MRPLIVPQPVTTPSPASFVSAMPNSVARWVTNMSHSSNEPWIEQQFDALARRQLALGVLGVDALCPAARPRLRPPSLQFLENFVHWLSPARCVPSNPLDRHRCALAAADADRRDAALEAVRFQRIEQGYHDARAGSADRVAERAGAAMDVELLARNAQISFSAAIGTTAKASLISHRSNRPKASSRALSSSF